MRTVYLIRKTELNNEYITQNEDLQVGDCLVKRYNHKVYKKAFNGRITLENIQHDIKKSINK